MWNVRPEWAGQLSPPLAASQLRYLSRRTVFLPAQSVFQHCLTPTWEPIASLESGSSPASKSQTSNTLEVSLDLCGRPVHSPLWSVSLSTMPVSEWYKFISIITKYRNGTSPLSVFELGFEESSYRGTVILQRALRLSCTPVTASWILKVFLLCLSSLDPLLRLIHPSGRYHPWGLM